MNELKALEKKKPLSSILFFHSFREKDRNLFGKKEKLF